MDLDDRAREVGQHDTIDRRPNRAGEPEQGCFRPLVGSGANTFDHIIDLRET